MVEEVSQVMTGWLAIGMGGSHCMPEAFCSRSIRRILRTPLASHSVPE